MEQGELFKFPLTKSRKSKDPQEYKLVALRECPLPEKMQACDTPVIAPHTTVRTLKIEADGDRWKDLIKPKIRLMGRWLERAGFKPGSRVHVACIARGIIELRASDGLENEVNQSSS
jgi:hypothetical protein